MPSIVHNAILPHSILFLSYLSGSKRYLASGELGYETDTLDLQGSVTKKASFDHVTLDAIEAVLPEFRGKISQVPPVYSGTLIQ